MFSGALYLVGAGLVGVGLGVGVAAGLYRSAPVEAARPHATIVAEPHQVLPPATPPVAIAAATPDPVQNDVEVATPPVDVAGITSVGATMSDPHQMLPVTPIEAAAPATPDPVQDDVAASAPVFDLAGTSSIVVALPEPDQMPPATQLAAIAPASDPVQDEVEASASSVDVAGMESVGAADPGEMLPPARPVLVSLFRPAPAEENVKPVIRVVESPNECLVAEICIDDYLWAFYERTPKVDTNKVKERIKALVKRKGKTRIVMKTVTKYVLADFTWKDPIAAQRAGKSLKDYVIGGMDRRFKLKLYYALRTMEEAGLMPGITSAFRDDYRQGIASGNKAASDSSYHGGSRRGGYGHGLAADLVSVKGETRNQRFASTVEMWKWIDAREKELGIGRPYLNRDPPHVGPIDGTEFAVKRGGARAKLLASAANKRRPIAAGAVSPGVPAAKPAPVRVGSL
jgi:hypothetical protein